MGHKARSGQERPSRGPWFLNLCPESRRGFWWQKWPPEGPSLGRSPPDPSGPLRGDPEVTAHHGRSLPFPTPCPPKEQLPSALPCPSRGLFICCQEIDRCVLYPESLRAFPPHTPPPPLLFLPGRRAGLLKGPLPQAPRFCLQGAVGNQSDQELPRALLLQVSRETQGILFIIKEESVFTCWSF